MWRDKVGSMVLYTWGVYRRIQPLPPATIRAGGLIAGLNDDDLPGGPRPGGRTGIVVTSAPQASFPRLQVRPPIAPPRPRLPA
ncbi:hypothetical protein NH44784_044661 [Achromobacter xylosoxidans NH44784-1996]|nr:hypothetical protein NH44784_044661 [Achromobacter xylosoxidans NH44784-1996]